MVPSSASVRKWFGDADSIVQQGQRGVLRDEQHVDAAVVVEVADGQSAPQPGHLPGRPGAVGDVDELARTVAEEELRGHRVGDRGAVVVDVAVGLRQVEAAVVVGVERGQPEAEHEAGRRGEAGRGRPVAEQAARRGCDRAWSTRRRSW